MVEDEFDIFLRLVSLLPKLSRVIIACNGYIEQMPQNFGSISSVFDEEDDLCIDYYISVNKRYSQKLDNLSFKLDMFTLGVGDQKDNPVQYWHKYVSKDRSTTTIKRIFDSYDWKIRDKEMMTKMKSARQSMSFFSPIFDLNIFLYL